MIYKITSKDNRKVVEASKLRLNKYQEETGLFLVEGHHMLDMASKYQRVQSVFTTTELSGLAVDQYLVSEDILRKIASSKNPQGVVAICQKTVPSPDIKDKVLYLDDISDPGNLGTIIRTALAFGYLDVLLSSQCTSPFSDKAISASQGALFAVNLMMNGEKELVRLKSAGYQIVATSLKDSLPIEKSKIEKRHIVILGNESRGVREELLALADKKVKIAISGIDSLNVSVAAGIVLYAIEAKSR